jgi:acetyltransferase-like isoleucine patch superfamily enzyme
LANNPDANGTRVSTPFVHPQALVESKTIGGGTRIWAFAHVQKDVVIGENCNVGDHCFIESGVRIGNDVVIKNGVSVWTGVTLDDRVFVGPNAAFTNDTVPRAKVFHETPEQTHVCEGASIGANATLLSGITIGRFALIGAGTVVTKTVPPFAVVKGNPGRVSGYRCACGEKIPQQGAPLSHRCTCGRRFTVTLKGVTEEKA